MRHAIAIAGTYHAPMPPRGTNIILTRHLFFIDIDAEARSLAIAIDVLAEGQRMPPFTTHRNARLQLQSTSWQKDRLLPPLTCVFVTPTSAPRARN